MANSSARFRLALTVGLVGLLSLSACVDGPSAPGSATPVSPLMIAPVFSLAGPAGSAGPLAAAQADALNAAFDQVNRFRMVVRTTSTNAVVLDTVIAVTPGQDQYDLTVNIAATPGETYAVTLTAMHGSTELFTSDPITVTSTPPQGATTGTPTPTNVTLRYSGPGATATSVSLSPSTLVLGPGGSASLSATVQDQNGGTVADVPIAWASGSTSVATVSTSGAVGGVSDGVVSVTATTPTGLHASTWVYVVGGTLAYVDGGVIKTRGPAGGTPTSMGGSSASNLSWSADGQKLYYVEDGSVRLAGVGQAIVSGTWPSLSPDGTKLAVDVGGVVFANSDGSDPTSGPSGTMPLWLDGENLVVAGGSIQRVHADGTGRTTVVSGNATWPALAPDGRIAYVVDGSLKVTGTDAALLTGALGRPTWSPNGLWLIVRTSSGLSLVPADGSAPAVVLPGLASASSPAMKPSGTLQTPPAVTVTGLQPANPVPGDVVTIVGSGFDWIIPANNQVIWPTSDGTANGVIKSVTPTAIQVVMPLTVAAGQVRVQTRTSQALMTYQPSLGTLDVTARTFSGKALAGLSVVALDKSGAKAASGLTDATGELILPGFVPGDYTLHLTPPTGFTLQGDSVRAVTLTAATLQVDVVLAPHVTSLKTTPATLSVEAQGFAAVSVAPLDILGDTIRSITTATWAGSPSTLISVSGSGLSGSIAGVAPGGSAGAALLSVTLGDTTFSVPVTVTSFIHGTVTKDAGVAQAPTETGPSPVSSAQPDSGVTVHVLKGGTLVGSAVTDVSGRYTVHGLFAGTYTVRAVAPTNYSAVPDSQIVVLSGAHPTGTADILMSSAPVDSVSFSGLPDTLTAIGATATLIVTPHDSTGAPLSGRPTTFASSAPAIATVNTSGKVTAVDNGVAWIRVTVQSVVDSVKVTVAQKAVSIMITKDENDGLTPQPDSIGMFVPDTGTVTWRAEDANGHLIHYKLPTFSSSDTSVATVDTLGHGNVIGVGKTWIKAQMDAAADSVHLFAFGVWDAYVKGNVTDAQLQIFDDSMYGKIINGDLVVDSSSQTNLNHLHYLQEVDGNVLIQVNPSLSDIAGLGNLEQVTGNVIISYNPVLATPASPTKPAALESVGGSFRFLHNASITNADVFSNLHWVGGDLEVNSDSALTNLDGLDSLNSVGGELALINNPSLDSKNSLPNLQEIGGDAYIDGGGQVLGLPSLMFVPGELVIGGTISSTHTILKELDLPSLQCTGAGVSIYSNDSLAIVKLPALNSLSSGCGSPPVAPPALASSRTRVRAAVPAAERAGRARMQALARDLKQVRATRDAVAKQRTASRHAERVQRRQMWLQKLEARRAAVARPGAPAFKAPTFKPSFATGGPSRTSSLNAPFETWDNPLLGTLDLSSLSYVDGDLYLSANGPLGDLSLPNLGIVEGTIDIEYEDGLTSFTASSLHDVNTDIYLSDNIALTTFSVDNLHQIQGYVDVEYCDALATFSAQKLQYVGQEGEGNGMYFYVNPALTSLSFPMLNTVTGDMDFESTYAYGEAPPQGVGPLRTSPTGDALQSISAPALTNVSGSMWVDGFPNLSTIQIATNPGVSLSMDNLEVYGNDALTSVNVPGLTHLDGEFYLYGNTIAGPVTLGSAGHPLSLGSALFVSYNNSLEVPPTWSLSAPDLVQTTSVDLDTNEGLTSVAIGTNGGDAADLGTVWVGFNSELTSLTLPTATHASSITINNNVNLTSVSFPALTQVMDPSVTTPPVSSGSTLSIANSPVTTADFPMLTQIGGSLIIDQTGLANLNGFSALTSAIWDLTITDNPSLTNVTGLNAIGSVEGNATITGNTSLPAASAQALGDGLTVAGTKTVTNNGS